METLLPWDAASLLCCKGLVVEGEAALAKGRLLKGEVVVSNTGTGLKRRAPMARKAVRNRD